MTTSTRFKPRITLFWRLFLSLLLTILLTSVLSIVLERALNEKALNARMDSQIERLLVKREVVAQVLKTGDLASVRQMYRQDRPLMSQIRIYDEQGATLFPRYRDRSEQMQRRERGHQQSMSPLSPSNRSDDDLGHDNSRHNQADVTNRPSILPSILQPVMPSDMAITNSSERPELADKEVILPDGQAVIIQLRPQLRFADVIALQRGHFPIRLLLILVFGVLVCIWLSRTLTKRIRRVQLSVHRMTNGDYQASPNLSKMGDDEIGLLAKDVATLSTRLAESELARKQMLSDISHELRSPLARLEVATELTRDFAPTAHRYLDRIDKESARMNELIEQIIHIQSLQMQQYTSNSVEEEVDIAEIISKIGQDVCFEFQQKNINWQWQPPTFASIVRGNQEQLHSALENIIRNAFMHTSSKSAVSVQIIQALLDNRIPAIKIIVMDEGGGIADADLKRIFQPFVRLDAARHRKTGGYGLGLAIVQAVVTAHKGKVSVSNRQDGRDGLVVEVVLPLESHK
ncbi:MULTISPECIES: sensor histidine kinase [unclassified Psychrobacter]|uniref:sensor histidine kinase n=1 Tax=unclassified Psychrobacter TaxID=196806 RepID=UPI003FD35768